MLQGSNRGERLTRGLKLPGFLQRLFKELAGDACFPFAQGASRSLATEHVLPSVVRTEEMKAALGCRPSGDGFYFLGINFTNESAFLYCRFA